MSSPSTKYFKKSSDNRFFNKNGYLLIDLLDMQEADALSEYLIGQDMPNNGFHSVRDIQDDNRVKANRDFIFSVCVPKLSTVLERHEAVLGSFLIKKKLSAKLGFHMDAPFIEENNGDVLNVWIPLVDIDEHNGVVNVIPESHKLPKYPRVFPVSDFPVDDETQRLLFQSIVPVPMKRGQALIFPLSLIHNSSPNFSNFDRPAISLACIEKGKQLCVWKKDNEGYSQFEVDNLLGLMLRDTVGKKLKSVTQDEFKTKYEKFITELHHLLKGEKRTESLLNKVQRFLLH